MLSFSFLLLLFYLSIFLMFDCLIDTLKYQLQGLMDGLYDVLNKRKKEEELDTELTRIDIIKCIQSERVRFRGVNLSGLDLSKLVIYQDLDT